MLAASSAGVAQVPYSVTDLCAPAICVQSVPAANPPVLNDNGAVAGVIGSGAFVLYPGQEMININQQTGLTEMFTPLWINNQGVLAGVGSTLFSPAADALLYVPGGLILDLNPVFGWYFGEARYITDTNIITGYGQIAAEVTFPPCPGLNFVPGIACTTPLRITETGIVVGGNLTSPSVALFVYSPSTGITYLSGSGLGYNEIGHVVEVVVQAQSTATYLLYTPAGGEAPLPLGLPYGPGLGIFNLSLNDSDQMVFTTTLSYTSATADVNPYFYSAATGLVPLDSLVADSDWTFNNVYAINNRGQILALGINAVAGRTTFVLLTPAGLPPFIYTTDAVDAPAPAIEAEGQGRLQWRDCMFAALNNVRLGAGLCSKRSPDR